MIFPFPLKFIRGAGLLGVSLGLLIAGCFLQGAF
jgi:hypothetical protein